MSDIDQAGARFRQLVQIMEKDWADDPEALMQLSAAALQAHHNLILRRTMTNLHSVRLLRKAGVIQ